MGARFLLRLPGVRRCPVPRASAKRLRHDGHRVRIATHGKFRTFVKEHELEFFDIGGDPEDLMSYMVRSEQ